MQWVRREPECAEAFVGRGRIWFAREEFEKARADYGEAIRLKPDHAEAFNNLGVLLEQLGRIAEATQSYQASLRSKPDSADTHKNLALSWLMRGEFNRGCDRMKSNSPMY